MAKQITKSDIAEDDIFGNVKNSANTALTVIDKLNAELRESAGILSKDIKGVKFGSAKEIKEFTKAIQEANKLKQDTVKLDTERAKLVKELTRIEQEEEKVKQQKLKTEKEELSLLTKIKAEKEKENKARTKAIKLENDENNAYKKLVKSTRDQKNESKKLAVELINLESAGKKNTAEWKRLNTQYQKVTKSAQKGDKALKKIDKTVGDNFRNVGNYRGAIGKLTGVLSGLGLAFGGFQIIKGAGETIAEFGQQVADLKAITGASGEDLDFLKERAISMSGSVEGGASAVIEAYKLIASAKPELLENAKALDSVAQSAITLSNASGMDLTESATRLTDALNQFNAPAEEAGKFIDVLASGAKFGSAEIPQITDALLKFGAVANVSNVSIQESTALIETLAEKGLKGAEAGTAIRNVMLKLSAPDALPKEAVAMMEKLGISFDDITDTSKPFSERLEAMKPLLKSNTALIKVFGKENAVAGLNLLEGTERIKELTVAVDENGVATEQAKTRTDTLSGAFLELKNEFSNWILSISEGANVGEGLKSLLFGLANNFKTVIGFIKKGVQAFIIYRGIIIAVAIRQKLLSLQFKGMGKSILTFGKNLVKSGKGMLGLNKGMKGATKGVKGFGNALKSIPLILIIGLIVELATAIWDVVSGTEAERLELEKLQKDADRRDRKREAEKEKASKRNETRNNKLSSENAKLERKRRTDIAKGTKTQKQADADTLEGKKKILRSLRTEIEAEAKKENARKKTAQNQLDFLTSPLFDKLSSADKTSTLAEFDISNKVTGIKELQKETKAHTESVKLLQIEYDSYGIELTEVAVEEIEAVATSKKRTGSVKKLNTEFSNQIELLKELNKLKKDNIDLSKDLFNLDTEEKVISTTENIEKEKKKAIEKATKTGKVDIEIAKLYIQQKEDLLINQLEIEAKFSKNSLQKSHDENFRILQTNLDKELKEKLSQAGLSEEQKKIIQAGFDKEQQDLNKLKIQSQQNVDKEILVIEKETNIEVRKIRKETAEETKELIEGVNEGVEIYSDKQIQDNKDKLAKILENQKEWAQKSKAIIKSVSDYFIKKSNEKIAGYQKEITKAEEQANVLQQLAINGNITAKESLAEQNRLIAEANKKKLAEERKQNAIKQAQIILETYLTKVENGDKTPLLSTIQDISLLNAFIATIPAFFDGTEDTGTNGSGIDGKGGFQAILHPNERVLTKEQNKKIGNISNEELANFANDYNTGNIIGKSGAIQIGNGWNTSEIVEKLDSLQNTIKNKPESNLYVEDIVRGAMTITRETRKGNSVIFNRYKVKG